MFAEQTDDQVDADEADPDGDAGPEGTAEFQSEGEAEVLVHWALAEDIRNIKRVKDAMAGGKPLPMALRENRIWGPKERLMERLLPRVSDARAAELLQSAHAVDGIVKGLPSEGWPRDSWQALRQLAMQLAQAGR